MTDAISKHLTQQNVAVAGAIITITVGAYVKIFPDATPTENIVDDIRAIQKSCEADKVFLRATLTRLSNQLDECQAEHNKIKDLEERVKSLEQESGSIYSDYPTPPYPEATGLSDDAG